ncbi:CU044_5270 family protein [Sphaerisporangium sp. NPDC049002]|uniref:CU044_5270 family protein n=1 Tax=unclassified Sphaerisporangium TaxID=2630420 RepID=UPI0033C19421
MNPMDQLRAARPAHLDTPVDEATRASELSYAMAGARTRRTRRIAKPVWGGLALAGAATVTAVAVAVSGTGGTTPRAPSLSEAAPSSAGTTPVIRLSAQRILLAAADSSLRARVSTGAYWYVDSVIGSAYEAGTQTRYLVHSTTSHRLWIARSPRGESWFVDRNLGTRPAKGAEDAWARDGSPAKWSVELPKPKADDKNALGRMELDSTPGRPFGNPVNDGDKVFELAGGNVSVADLQALPTTAKALKQRLLEGYAGHGTESDDPQDADSWLYQVTSGLLRDMPVKPAVRAAAYKVLAGLGGVRSLGEVTDTLGRTGQGIARPENWSGGRFERQLIIDPETGILLTDQIVAVRATGGYAWAKPGTPIWWEATREAAWTDKAPEKP